MSGKQLLSITTLSSMARAAGPHNPPWRMAALSSCGARPAVSEMQANPNRSHAICSRNAARGLRWTIPAIHICLTSSTTPGGGRREALAMCSGIEAETGATADLILSTGSTNLDGTSEGDVPVDLIPRPGGATEIEGSESGGGNEGEDCNETTHEAGSISPAGRNLGRRAALLLGTSTLWSGLGCCRLCGEALAEEDWDYGGPDGPAKWEGLCTRGSLQSPVDITPNNTKEGGSLGVLNFFYAPSPVSVKNTGHGTIQVSFGQPNNFLRVRGHTLQLLQFHFHAPSEHAFDGERYPMEAHLVHRDPVSTKICVVGVMLDASKDASPNECLAASLAYVPQEHGSSVDAPIEVSPNFLLPPAAEDGSRGYVHYDGSLTTPPCTESVEWFVLDTAVTIASFQVVDFMRFSGDGHSLAFNSRPLQPLGDRKILKGP